MKLEIREDKRLANKLFYDILYFGVALQLTLYLFSSFNFFAGSPLNYSISNLSLLSNTFNVSDTYSVLVGGVGFAAIGLASLLLRQGVYAIYAMLLWAIGIVFNFISGFFLIIPNMLSFLLPAETNPNPALFALNPITVVIGVVVAFAAWLYMLGLVLQREVG